MSSTVSRIYRVCDACKKEVRRESQLFNDGNYRLLCRSCLDAFEIRREIRQYANKCAYDFARCTRCNAVKPRTLFHMPGRLGPAQHNGFTHRSTPPTGICETCWLLIQQAEIAEDAEERVRHSAILSLVSRSHLRRRHLPENLIKTKVAQLKTQNLWQSPKI